MGRLFSSIWQKAELGLINPAFGTPPKMRRATGRPICSLAAAAREGHLALDRAPPTQLEAKTTIISASELLSRLRSPLQP